MKQNYVLFLILRRMLSRYSQKNEPNNRIVTPFYKHVTTSHLSYKNQQLLSMDAGIADLDLDGDLDIIIANEHKPNFLIINDGKGMFTNESARILQVNHDKEDIGIADFDLDRYSDIIVVSEDDKTNVLYLNKGGGIFTDDGNRIPISGISNSVVVYNINNDGAPDVLIGNTNRPKFDSYLYKRWQRNVF